MFPVHSLVLYKHSPALITHSGDKLEIRLEDGSQAKVRPKDVILLHPGPLESLSSLKNLPSGELALGWEMLSETPDNAHSLQAVAELVYGEFSPLSAWAIWQHVADGLFFHGTPLEIYARSAEEVQAAQTVRQARQAEAQAWENFITRAGSGQIDPLADGRFLRDVEDVACGRRSSSRVLQALGRSARPETAHAFLLECGAWKISTNPYPMRLGLPSTPPETNLAQLPQEERLDLTHLPAFAIDDRDNQDPDDAISLQTIDLDEQGNLLGGRMWVHVADAAALIPPDSLTDLAARGRGATLYLPEGPVQMLPPEAIPVLGLGLQEVSPALSFELSLNAHGEINSVDIHPTWVKVQRLSYEKADEMLVFGAEVDENLRAAHPNRLANSQDLHGLEKLAQAFFMRRQANGALLIDLPEAIMHVKDGQIEIRPLLRLRSRELVREAMLMTGEAAARFAIQHAIPFPFASQDGPDAPTENLQKDETTPFGDMAGKFALRKTLKRSQTRSHPAPHAGVGLPAYSRVTSPLRRYLDLAAHQQLRAFLNGQPPLNEQAMLERLGAAEAVIGSVNRAEALSRRHWTLVYFLQNPGWQGQGVLVEKQGLRAKVILPELAFETNVHLRQDLPLNSTISLAFQGLNLPELEAHFTHLTEPETG